MEQVFLPRLTPCLQNPPGLVGDPSTWGMAPQHEVKRTLSRADSVEVVRSMLSSHQWPHRSAVAAAVCERFGFHDARG